jgi:hypothetical protein
MLSLFGFGKKRRSAPKKSSKKVKKSVKPPAKLLKMCKKLRVKVSLKRGGKRVYKKAKVLAKQCKRKLRMIEKAKKARKGTRFGASNSRKVRRSRFGSSSTMDGYHMMPNGKMMADRDMMFGASCGASNMMNNRDMMFGASKLRFAGRTMGTDMEFGKKRKVVSKAAAMKAFKQFFRRHCKSTVRMGRRTRFGNGGNPPLYQSMGYEFCDLGSGGVLGANSTGLFPSPCHKMNMKQARAEESVVLADRYGGSDKEPESVKAADKARAKNSAFGKKRKVSKRKSVKKAVKKPSAKVLKLAKKLKIKVTVKRGSKRTYKSVKLLNKQIKKALKKSH